MSELLPPSPVAPWRARLAELRDAPAVRVAGAIITVAVVACVAVVLLRDSASPEIQLPRAVARSSAPTATVASTDTPTSILVHIAGAVAQPGVQRLSSTARVADALAAAGGPTPDADVDAINLAAKLGDGDRVYVPRKGEAPPAALAASAGAGATARPDEPLDLNRATAEQLDTLPGVGPATARAIVEYRAEHGRFRSVDELLAVRGIGPAKLASLRSRLRV